jgi:hypothetical protein
MQVINNQTRINHQAKLLDSWQESDNITIVSPYLSSNFDFFPFEKIKHIDSLTLLTTLKSKNDDQRNKVNFFRQLLNFGKNENIDIKILIDNSLHGKLYINQKNNIFTNAIITSANFTSNGLRINNEWGIIIEEHDVIKDIVTELYGNIIHEPITEDLVKEFEEFIKSNPKPDIQPKDDLDLSKNLKLQPNPLNNPDNINYWLKPIGSKTEMINWETRYDKIDTDLHFSDKKPSGVKQGDILITYAVGHKNILSIYRVTSDVRNTGKATDRWPYFVVGKNLTPYYGKEWNKYSITITNQKKKS